MLATHERGARYAIERAGARWIAEGVLDGERLEAEVDGERCAVWVVPGEHGERVMFDGPRRLAYHWRDPLAGHEAAGATGGHLVAPMPAKVIAVRASEGQRVSAGAVLVVLEAMKMEQSIVAPADGVVERVFYAPGDQVSEGATLVDFAADEEA